MHWKSVHIEPTYDVYMVGRFPRNRPPMLTFDIHDRSVLCKPTYEHVLSRFKQNRPLMVDGYDVQIVVVNGETQGTLLG